MLGQIFGMRPAFLMAAGTVLVIAAAFAWGVREPAVSASHAEEANFRAILEAASSAVPGMRAIFAAVLLLQLTFQTFTTWYSLHGTERFGVRPEDVTIGLIAWAVGGVLGVVPAGFLGMRIGRRTAMLLGFALMAVCLVALDRVTSVSQATPLLAWHRPVGRSRRSMPTRCSSSRFHGIAVECWPPCSCCAWPWAARWAIR